MSPLLEDLQEDGVADTDGLPLNALAPRRTSYSAVDLMASEFPEPKYAVPGIVAEGLNLFAGAPKIGKSWAALGLALSVASGGHALGKVPVERGDVLYLALEDSPRRLQSRIRSLLGPGESVPEGLHFETEWPRLTEGGIEAINKWLWEHPDCRLVVVDVFAKVRPANGSDRSDRYLADYGAVAPLNALAQEHGVAFLVLHHTRKAQADDFLDSVSGTQGLAGAADAVLVMRRSRGRADAELHVTGRDIEEQSYALRFDGQVGSWTLLGNAEEYALRETRAQILEVLRAHGAMTPKKLSDISEIPHELAKKTLQRMANDGQLVAENGTYSLAHDPVTPVPGVPLSPEPEQIALEEPTKGHRDSRDTPLGTCEVCDGPCGFTDEEGRVIHVGCKHPGSVSVQVPHRLASVVAT